MLRIPHTGSNAFRFGPPIKKPPRLAVFWWILRARWNHFKSLSEVSICFILRMLYYNLLANALSLISSNVSFYRKMGLLANTE